MNQEIVIFRKDRTGWKDCFALFPELPADNYGPDRISILRQIAVQAQQDPPAIFLVGDGSLYGTVGTGLTWAPNVQGYIPVVGVSYTP